MGIRDELAGFDRELFMFPVRAFEFKNAGTITISQDMADVGSVVWDAEVVLAHYIDLTHGFRLRGTRFLELGAGTGLAGIVAAKLGATVFLTDQSKLLPTIIANARANAPELEVSPACFCERNSLRDAYPSEVRQVREKDRPADDDDDDDDDDSARASSSLHEFTRQDADLTTEGGAQLSDSSSRVVDLSRRAKSLGNSCGADVDVEIEIDQGPNSERGSLRIPDPDSNQRGCDLGNQKSGCKVDVHTPDLERPGAEAREIDTRGVENCARKGGSWRVAELPFSEDESKLRAAVGLGTEDNGCAALFDLVVAADVVYLVHLWDALAFTIKTLVKPGGRALLSFEQRRGSVDSFFSAPRFGPHEPSFLSAASVNRDEWSQGEEIAIEDESSCTVLGKAAVAANVRMFRVTRRDKSPPLASGGGAKVSLGHGVQRSTCP